MSGYYGRSRDILGRAHATLDRLANIDEQIAERRRLESLGLLPEPHTPPPPPEPTQEAEEDIDPETPITAGVMMDLIYLLRCEFGQELDAMREQVQAALKARRRNRKGKAAAATPANEENGSEGSI